MELQWDYVSPADLQIGQVLAGHAGVLRLVPQLALLHGAH